MAEDSADDRMRHRVDRSTLRFWLLTDANRWVVAAIPLALVFAVLVVLGALDPSPLRSAVSSSDPIETLGQGLLTALITGVTLVVTINQLVLSQELGPLGDQSDRMAGTMEFRDETADVLGKGVPPPEPSAFLRDLLRGIAEDADELDAVADEESDTASLAHEVREHATEVADRLDGRQFGTFDVVSAALDFNYSRKLYETQRIRSNDADDRSDEETDALDALVETLTRYGPAREHVKTLYFRWELVNLSRSILVAALPALVVTIAAILYLDDTGTIVGTTFGVDNLVWTASALATVALAPFTILGSYVFRVSTVAKRTLSIGPFVLRSSSRDDEES